MENINNYKKVCLIGIFLTLVFSVWFILNSMYNKMPFHKEKVITIGVFSDSYWEVQNGYSYKILEDAIQLFEEQNPGVQVEYVSGILKEDYSEWLSEQLLMGKAPDVFFVLGEDFNDFAQIGALKDLTSVIEKDKAFEEEAFYSSAYAYGFYNKIQYSLPYECAPKLMFVNRTILDKEDVCMPEENWTWDDFYAICKQVTKDTNGDSVIDQFGVVDYTWQEAFDSNGIKLFNQQGSECYFTEDGVEEAISFIEKMDKLNGGYSVTNREFDIGNVAFQPMLFSEFRAYKSYPLSIKKYSGFEWECIPMPAGPSGDNISKLDTLHIAMNADTSESEYAWKLMKTLTCNEQIQSEIFDYSEGVSVLKKVTEADRTLHLLLDESGNNSTMNLAILSDAVENAVVAPRFRNYDAAVSEVDKAIDAIIAGNSNISMDQIIWNRTINNYLKDLYSQ